MAGRAIRRKLRSSVVRIRRSRVFWCMTAIAGIWCRVIITVMTRRTIIGNRGMCTVQSIIIVVYRERGRIPARCSRMAHCAIRRNAQRYVVRVGGLVKICRMTTRTSIGRIVIIDRKSVV